MSTTVSAVAVPASAKVTLTITNSPSATVYVYRRDSLGVATVRASQDGLTGTSLTVDDYELRQGDSTDYLVTNQDGTLVASTNLTIPSWGSWVKSPSQPWLNAKVTFLGEKDTVYGANREVVWVEGAQNPVVLWSVRSGATTDSVSIACRTQAEVSALLALLSAGSEVMLDLTPSWNSKWRYCSVGDVAIGRVFEDGLGLDNAWRVVELKDLVQIDNPITALQVAAGASYDAIPVKFPTYGSIPAILATYNSIPVY